MHQACVLAAEGQSGCYRAVQTQEDDDGLTGAGPVHGSCSLALPPELACLSSAGCSVLLTAMPGHMQSGLLTNLTTNQAAQHDGGSGVPGIKIGKELMHVAGRALKMNITRLAPLVLPLSEKIFYACNILACKVLMSHALHAYIPAPDKIALPSFSMAGPCVLLPERGSKHWQLNSCMQVMLLLPLPRHPCQAAAASIADRCMWRRRLVHLPSALPECTAAALACRCSRPRWVSIRQTLALPSSTLPSTRAVRL